MHELHNATPMGDGRRGHNGGPEEVPPESEVVEVQRQLRPLAIVAPKQMPLVMEMERVEGRGPAWQRT